LKVQVFAIKSGIRLIEHQRHVVNFVIECSVVASAVSLIPIRKAKFDQLCIFFCCTYVYLL